MFMNLGQFRRSYSFPLNEPLITLISKTFSVGIIIRQLSSEFDLQTGRYIRKY
jgi:hypothetical protein